MGRRFRKVAERNLSVPLVLSVLVFALSMLFSCVDDLAVSYPPFEERAVLMGELSVGHVSVTLTKTFPPTRKFDASKDAIENAIVDLFENGIKVAQLEHLTEGHYGTDYKPTKGHTYTIKANTGSSMLEASDSLIDPPLPTISVSGAQKDNPNSNPNFVISVPHTRSPAGTYWFCIREATDGVDSGLGWYHLVSGSNFLDTFNASNDQFYPVKNFGFLARLKSNIDISGDVTLSTSNQWTGVFRRNAALVLRVIYASSAYDMFLKSTVTAADNRLFNENGTLNNPFYEPTTIYSNVKGGLGIFGATSSFEYTVLKL